VLAAEAATQTRYVIARSEGNMTTVLLVVALTWLFIERIRRSE
jgi:hypothetical protein